MKNHVLISKDNLKESPLYILKESSLYSLKQSALRSDGSWGNDSPKEVLHSKHLKDSVLRPEPACISFTKFFF